MTLGPSSPLADGFCNGFIPVPFHQANQTLIDSLDGERPFIDEAGIDLHSGRTGLNLFIGIFRAEDPSDPDDRQLSADSVIKMPHKRSCQAAQRFAA